ncbi:hypothetical protein [Mycoplasmopsis gallopavonis]|uniref:DUF4231 domain-containing protein n=1 Tax=Mycoplasmopsis gallopavonis TaxID=76629 RepID=A0A449AZY7_9BACT|nr:hypothetical protein [Mycoplasmopsis gallopavonis]RIV16317.1 hypothetical protein D1113_02815 [Mycoplasmopsis gallopavonis]VEU73109.1 Uncharacterised protein [Mycoplasmopsis gallopavonis]
MKEQNLDTQKLLENTNEIQKKIKYKYWKSRGVFISLSLIALIIAAVTVILNLSAIRFNEIPALTMNFFVAMAVLTVLTTLLVSLQSFFNIQERKNILNENISKNEQIAKELKEGKEMTQEDIDQILNTIT